MSETLVIRGVPLEIKKAIRSAAGAEDKSMNQKLLEILIAWVSAKQ